MDVDGKQPKPLTLGRRRLLRLLDATATCDAGTSVMKTNACGVIDVADVIDPTSSDTAAIVKAIYGSANKKTCGW